MTISLIGNGSNLRLAAVPSRRATLAARRGGCLRSSPADVSTNLERPLGISPQIGRQQIRLTEIVQGLAGRVDLVVVLRARETGELERIYRKMVENDYLFHREAYAQLRRVLLEEASQPFQFLDLACGDATAVATAPEGTGFRRGDLRVGRAARRRVDRPVPAPTSRRSEVGLHAARSLFAAAQWAFLDMGANLPRRGKTNPNVHG